MPRLSGTLLTRFFLFMLQYLIARFMQALAIVAFAALVSFVLLQAAPGDVVMQSADRPGRDAAAQAALRERLGLNRSVPQQALVYVVGVARGDFGQSFTEQRPVRAVLADALPATLTLSGAGLFLASLFGIVLGTAQGWWPENRIAATLGTGLTLLYTLPEVVVGVALIALFGLIWSVLPVGGMTDPLVELTGGFGAQFADRLRHLALPSFALALVWSAAIARQQRASIREVSSAMFVRTALAKGASDARILRKHALRAALPGTIAVIGTMLPALVGGTVIVETLFAWPGMGSLLVRSVALRDAPLVAGIVIVMALAIAIGTLITDAVVGWLDPRTRAGMSE